MGKNICVILLFDQTTSQYLKSLTEKAYAFDFSFEDNYPHLTIANYPGINPERIKRYFEGFFKDIEVFPLSFVHLIRLDDHVIAVEPGVSQTLTQIYQKFHEKYGQEANVWTQTSLANFHPHVSILTGESAMLNQLYPHIRNNFVPFNGYVTAVEVSEILSDGFKILAHIDLKNMRNIR